MVGTWEEVGLGKKPSKTDERTISRMKAGEIVGGMDSEEGWGEYCVGV